MTEACARRLQFLHAGGTNPMSTDFITCPGNAPAQARIPCREARPRVSRELEIRGPDAIPGFQKNCEINIVED
jgi:hypothetical protein